MMLFVLAYRRSSGVIIDRTEFPADQRGPALSCRDDLIRRYLSDPDVEVVMLGSDSEAMLRKTHGRYFVNEKAA
jgi:hypothetical protein